MALTDVQATFSDEQVVTVTAFGSNFYDTLAQKNNLGRRGARIKFTTDAAATAAGAATVAFEVVEADNSDGTGNTTILASSAAIPIANLTLGATGYDVPLPDTTRRYVGVRYTIGTGPLTAGKFTATVVGQGGSGHQRRYGTGYPQPYV